MFGTFNPLPHFMRSSWHSSLERLEKTVSHLLNRLGEDSSQLAHDTPVEVNPAQAITPDSGNPIPKGNDSAAAPVMVIRDLAADTGIELANTTQTVSIDRLVSADLALELISMSALLQPPDNRIVVNQP